MTKKKTEPPIPIARPSLGQAEAGALARVVASGWVMQGPEVEAFERELADFVGAPHACAVSSGTAALHLSLLAAGVQPGDEVITASHSFIATANAVRHAGALPVFADIQPGTFNLDPLRVEAALSPRTRAILCVHQLGMPCDIEALAGIARRAQIVLIEDAACAVGSEICLKERWERIGKPHGDLACFSFHPRKVITTGEGGMITTAGAELDRRLRQLRNHGAVLTETAGDGSDRGTAQIGFNYRLTDLQAAMGREQLRRLPSLLAERRELACRYHERLAHLRGLVLPEEPTWARSNWQSYCVRLPPVARQADVIARLLERGIASRPGIACAHRQPAYASGGLACGEARAVCGCPPPRCRRLSESERAEDEALMLPIYPGMTDAEQDRVIAALAAALPHA